MQITAQWLEHVGFWMLAVAIIASVIIMGAKENSVTQGVAVWTALMFGSWGVVLAFGGWMAVHASTA